MARPLAWRLVTQTRNLKDPVTGERRPAAYYHLTKGKKDPVNLILGFVTEEGATTALEKMNRHLEMNDETRVLRIYNDPAVPQMTSLGIVGETRPDTDPDTATLGRTLCVRYLTLPDLALDDVLGPPPVDYARMTVSEYFDEVYWPARINTAGPIGVEPTTATAEMFCWRHTGHDQKKNLKEKHGILDGVIGKTRMMDLTDQMWETWQDEQTHLSPRSKVIRRNAYSVLLSYARRKGHLTYKPEFFRLKGATMTTRKKEDPLSVDEVLRLLEVATSPVYRAMWAAAAGQGLRPGELVKVEWQDINWTDHTMLARGEKTEGSWDTIPMTPFAYRELKILWESLGSPKTGRAFTYGKKKPRAFRSYKKALATDVMKAGITRHVSPNLLRHSFVTLAFVLGIDKDTTRRMGRWTDEQMLDNVYCRPRPSDLVQKLKAFELAAK